MQRVTTSVCLGLMLVLSFRMISETLSKTPAFNANLRVENAFGTEQVLLVQAMYDYPDYLLQTGSSFVSADLLPTAETEGFDDYASTETAISRAMSAVILLEQSAKMDPGNALVWESLAWAYAMTGDNQAARQALGNSWARAPYDVQLADLRLALVDALFADEETLGAIEPMSRSEYDAIVRDIETLTAFSPGVLDFHKKVVALVITRPN